MSTETKLVAQPAADTSETEVNMEELLLTKVKLNDGSMEFMFSRGPKYNEKLWPIQCHLCRVGYMVNEKKLRAHLNSEKHTTRLAEGPPEAEAYRKPYEQLYSDRMRLMNPIKIMPGEVIEEVTTQHSDRLMPCKQYNWENSPSEEIIEKLSKDDIVDYNKNTAPIIGLCYAFKMYDASKKIKYYCSLCSSFFGEHNAYQHFVGIQDDHINEYAKRHYSEIIASLEKLIDKSVTEADKKKWMQNVIRHLYGKLEIWKGYRKMHIVDGPLFDVHRQRYLSKARKLLHYSDQLVNFSDSELLELIQTCKTKGQLYPDDPQRLPNQPEPPTKAELETERKAEEQRKRKNDSKDGGSSRKSSRSDSGNRQRNGPKLDESPQNWAKYRNLVERALRSLNDEYGRFVDMSENHPQYRVEWTRFWRRRCMELREDNINPNDYDFMPEWNRFWIRYLEDCYESDVDKCKFEIRKTLRLPFRGRTPDPPGNNDRRGNNNYNNNNNNSRSSLPQMSRGYDGHTSGGNNINNAGGNLNNSGGNRQTGPVPLMGIGTITPEPMHHQQQQQQQEIEIPTEPLSVLSVLRLLTALEDQLGSLGPTAIQLLSKAIFFEKETNSSANELLNENEYFKLFITALEKLKGQLLAKIVPEIKIKAVTKAVDDLDTILNLFEEYKRRNQEKNQPQQSTTASGSSNNNSGGNNPSVGGGGGGSGSGGAGSNQYSGNLGGSSGPNSGADQWRDGNNKGIGSGDGDNRNQGYGTQFGGSAGAGRDNNNSGMGGRSNWQTGDNNQKGNQEFGRDNNNGSNWRNNSGGGGGGDMSGGGGNNFRDNDRQLGNYNNRENDYEKKLQDNFSGQSRNNDFGGNYNYDNCSALNSNRNDKYNSTGWNTSRNQSQSGYQGNTGNDSFANKNSGNSLTGNLGAGGSGMDLGGKMDSFGNLQQQQQQMGLRSGNLSGGGNSNFSASYGYSTGTSGNSAQQFSSNNTGAGMYNRRY